LDILQQQLKTTDKEAGNHVFFFRKKDSKPKIQSRFPAAVGQIYRSFMDNPNPSDLVSGFAGKDRYPKLWTLSKKPISQQLIAE
jgi:hypothetical protein